MALIDQVKAHFASYGARTVEVPEWGEAPEKPLVIHYTPLTVAEQQRIQNAGNRGGDLHKVIECLIIKARDAEGRPLFTLEHKRDLLNNADPNVISRVVRTIMAIDQEEIAGK